MTPDLDHRKARAEDTRAALGRVIGVRAEDAERAAKHQQDGDVVYAHVRALEKRVARLERKVA